LDPPLILGLLAPQAEGIMRRPHRPLAPQLALNLVGLSLSREPRRYRLRRVPLRFDRRILIRSFTVGAPFSVLPLKCGPIRATICAGRLRVFFTVRIAAMFARFAREHQLRHAHPIIAR